MSAHCLISEQKLDYIREVVNQRDPKEDYKLIRSIGVGTYGEVYKVTLFCEIFWFVGSSVKYQGLRSGQNHKNRCKR